MLLHRQCRRPQMSAGRCLRQGWVARCAAVCSRAGQLSQPPRPPTGLQMKAFVPYMARKYDFDYE